MLHLLLAIQTNIGEIVFFGVIALIIGVVVHYLWSLRNRSYEKSELDKETEASEAHQWRLKYYELTEHRQQEMEELRKDLLKAHDLQVEMNAEIDELKELNTELSRQPKEKIIHTPEANPNEYLQQLKIAQEHLQEHNESIARLLQQSETLEQVQQKYQATLSLNESLNLEVKTLQHKLHAKEEELNLVIQRNEVALSMKHELENTYAEFHEMQEKLLRVEQHLTQTPGQVFKYEELEEVNLLLTGEVANARVKQKELTEENSRLHQELLTIQEKHREAEMQKQQLLKRNEFLEQINRDLQQVADSNKKMEAQIKRLSEMENLLAKISGADEPRHQSSI